MRNLFIYPSKNTAVSLLHQIWKIKRHIGKNNPYFINQAWPRPGEKGRNYHSLTLEESNPHIMYIQRVAYHIKGASIRI